MIKRFVLIGVLFIVVQDINCQSCDQLLSPIDNENLKYKSRGNRCEGFYSTDIAGSRISLVSLTCGSFDYSLSDSEIIEISPLFDIGKKIHIQSSSLILRKYYRMDSEISSDSKLEWPVADVLKPAQLTPEKIGILGKVLPEDNNTQAIIPLKVKSTIQTSDNCKKIQLIFNSNIDLDIITFYFGQLNKEDKPIVQLINDRIYYAGSPIILNIDVSSFENHCFFYITGRICNYTEKPDKADDKIPVTELDPYYFLIELPDK